MTVTSFMIVQLAGQVHDDVMRCLERGDVCREARILVLFVVDTHDL